MNNFYLDNIYKPDSKKIKTQVINSNLLFTDGTHRIVGIKFINSNDYQVEITYIGMRSEVSFAKKIALENGIKIIIDPNYSLILFRDYIVGEKVFFYYDNLSINNKFSKPNEALIRKCDVIITDEQFCSIGFKYIPGKMNAPKIVFICKEVKIVKEINLKYHCLEKVNRPLARELLKKHNPGEEINKLYYSCVANIYSELYKK